MNGGTHHAAAQLGIEQAVDSAAARGRAMSASRRFLLYSNEMIGLGHLRRTLAITEQLAQADAEATSLIVTGAPVQPLFELPPRVEAVTLPTLTRDGNGIRRSRRLALDADEIGRLRGEIARAVAIGFRPDCAIVDRFPLGLDGELRPALDALKASGTKLVLGLRDIEDDPVGVRRAWGPSIRTAIETYFDLILVYGPPKPGLDAIDCLGWHDLTLRVPLAHVGYVGTAVPASGPSDLPPGYVLATVGGGSDGFELLATFAEALRLEPLPCPAVIVTGPLMPVEDVERLLELTDGSAAVQVWRFRPDLERLVAGARAVVSMAGYNTVSELMRARKPALLVPRVHPIREQLVRASGLARRGLLDVLHPAQLSAATMRAALDRLLARPEPRFPLDDLRGTERTVEALRALVGGGDAGTAERTAEGAYA